MLCYAPFSRVALDSGPLPAGGGPPHSARRAGPNFQRLTGKFFFTGEDGETGEEIKERECEKKTAEKMKPEMLNFGRASEHVWTNGPVSPKKHKHTRTQSHTQVSNKPVAYYQ